MTGDLMVQLMVPKDIMVQALQDMGHSMPQIGAAAAKHCSGRC